MGGGGGASDGQKGMRQTTCQRKDPPRLSGGASLQRNVLRVERVLRDDDGEQPPLQHELSGGALGWDYGDGDACRGELSQRLLHADPPPPREIGGRDDPLGYGFGYGYGYDCDCDVLLDALPLRE